MVAADTTGGTDRQVVVVGGSLVGLSMAIALAHAGASVTVLERTPHAGYEGGGGLGVDVDLLTRVTGLVGGPPICQGIDRATTAWPLLAGWLETQASATPGVELRRGADVVEVGDCWARTTDGQKFDADLLVGADGARSTVRRWVSPDRPDAVYAGFLLWRAMVPEAELPAAIPRLRPDEPSREYYSGPYRLVTYPVPGADGSCRPGDRRLNLVWYDPARSELLASRDCSTTLRSTARWPRPTSRGRCGGSWSWWPADAGRRRGVRPLRSRCAARWFSPPRSSNTGPTALCAVGWLSPVTPPTPPRPWWEVDSEKASTTSPSSLLASSVTGPSGSATCSRGTNANGCLLPRPT